MTSERGASHKTSFVISASSFLASLAGLAWSWAAYAQGRAEVQRAIAEAGSSPAAELAAMRMGRAGAAATPGLIMACAGLFLGAVFLMRGLWRASGLQAETGRPAAAVAVALLLAGGVGLGLVALVDYLRFDDYFSLVLMLD
ncbi:MAG: hypothetical protein JXR96_13115 [Deltaproteobacteria bacterium]|nr:hypothetical protein [Deltaproteobacteria bacterium]